MAVHMCNSRLDPICGETKRESGSNGWSMVNCPDCIALAADSPQVRRLQDMLQGWPAAAVPEAQDGRVVAVLQAHRLEVGTLRPTRCRCGGWMPQDALTHDEHVAAAVLADAELALSAAVREGERERLARKVERLKLERPMNGDGHNYALGKVLDLLIREGGDSVAAAVEDERATRQRERDEYHERLEAENRARAAAPSLAAPEGTEQ